MTRIMPLSRACSTHATCPYFGHVHERTTTQRHAPFFVHVVPAQHAPPSVHVVMPEMGASMDNPTYLRTYGQPQPVMHMRARRPVPSTAARRGRCLNRGLFSNHLTARAIEGGTP